MQIKLAGAALAEKPVSIAAPMAGKYLVFQLGTEEFGVEVLKTREIIGMQTITGVPQAPPHVKGVINLRGNVIPVLDLRLKCGMPAAEYTSRTCIIVVQTAASAMTGVIVDGVVEVVNLAGDDIDSTCDFGRGVKVPYLLGMAKVKGKVKILLDIDQVLIGQQLYQLAQSLQ